MHQVIRQAREWTARGKEKRKKTMRVDKSHGIIILFLALLFFRNFFREIQVKKNAAHARATWRSLFYILCIYTHVYQERFYEQRYIFTIYLF